MVEGPSFFVANGHRIIWKLYAHFLTFLPSHPKVILGG
jgi:hypothetical protein